MKKKSTKILKRKKSAQAADTNGKQPTVISLFAGTGGSSLGYHLAGYKELLAVDFDAHAVECFRKNFPGVQVWETSVTELKSKDIFKFCKINRGELDVLDGSPPCQGFSTAGKRNVNDPRNDLFKHYVRLINELQPKVFVMENVSGMIKGSMRGRFIEIMNALKATGYNVKCKLMNAANYSVPQSRERLIFIGTRKDLGMEPSFPEKHKKMVTIAAALSGVKPVTLPKVKYLDEIIKRIPQGGSVLDVDWSIVSRYKPNWKKKGDFSSRLRRDRLNFVTYTLQKTFIPNSCECRLHPIENRYYSIEELLALCSFPSDWVLTGKYSERMARLGNAVMPKFMQAVATTIKKDILEKHQGTPS